MRHARRCILGATLALALSSLPALASPTDVHLVTTQGRHLVMESVTPASSISLEERASIDVKEGAILLAYFPIADGVSVIAHESDGTVNIAAHIGTAPGQPETLLMLDAAHFSDRVSNRAIGSGIEIRTPNAVFFFEFHNNGGALKTQTTRLPQEIRVLAASTQNLVISDNTRAGLVQRDTALTPPVVREHTVHDQTIRWLEPEADPQALLWHWSSIPFRAAFLQDGRIATSAPPRTHINGTTTKAGLRLFDQEGEPTAELLDGFVITHIAPGSEPDTIRLVGWSSTRAQHATRLVKIIPAPAGEDSSIEVLHESDVAIRARQESLWSIADDGSFAIVFEPCEKFSPTHNQWHIVPLTYTKEPQPRRTWKKITLAHDEFFPYQRVHPAAPSR